VTDVLLALIDGCELQVAAGLPDMDDRRLRELVLGLARRELGVR
jgi:hypothetical protein